MWILSYFFVSLISVKRNYACRIMPSYQGKLTVHFSPADNSLYVCSYKPLKHNLLQGWFYCKDGLMEPSFSAQGQGWAMMGIKGRSPTMVQRNCALCVPSGNVQPAYLPCSLLVDAHLYPWRSLLESGWHVKTTATTERCYMFSMNSPQGLIQGREHASCFEKVTRQLQDLSVTIFTLHTL